jgi:hypothetical protein
MSSFSIKRRIRFLHTGRSLVLLLHWGRHRDLRYAVLRYEPAKEVIQEESASLVHPISFFTLKLFSTMRRKNHE